MTFELHPSRRGVLIGAGGAATFAALPAWAQNPAPVLKRPIPQGKGEMLPVIGIGTSRVFEFENDPAADAERKQVLQALVAGGGTLIDTAAGYGTAEDNVGRLAKDVGLTGRIFWATKYSSRDSREEAEASLKQSLQRLRTNHIALMQAWNVSDANFSTAQLKEWQARGTVKHIGITSSFDAAYDALAQVIRREKPAFFQINYSLGDRDAEKVLLPLAKDCGCAVLTNLPFGRNSLFRKVGDRPLPDWAKEIGATSWAQVFLKYNLSHPAVTAVIPGTDKPQYMLDNLNAGRGRMPDAAMRRRIETYFDAL